jgi:hypothetical protein
MLSETKRHELIGLIVAGYSRYAAAKKVGCARSTIYRLAARDPVFGERLAEAEELAGGPDTRAFLQQPKHWREAARVLQQINPEDFRLRRRQVPSTSFSLRGEAELFGELMEMVLPVVSDEVYSLLIREINKLLAAYDSCDVPQLEDATKTEFPLDRDLDSPSQACATGGSCATACLEGKQCSDSVSSESWEALLALQASSGTPPQPDEPDNRQPAPVDATIDQAEEPVLQRSPREWPTYVDSARSNTFSLNGLAICDASNVFAQIQNRRARKSKRTAHGGKAVVHTPSTRRPADLRESRTWHSERSGRHERAKEDDSASGVERLGASAQARLLDVLEQLGEVERFHKIGDHRQFHGTDGRAEGWIARDDNHRHPRSDQFHLLDQLKVQIARHFEIGDQQVIATGRKEAQGSEAIGRAVARVSFVLQELDRGPQERLLVVGKQQPERLRHTRNCPSCRTRFPVSSRWIRHRSINIAGCGHWRRDGPINKKRHYPPALTEEVHRDSASSCTP